MLGRETTTFVAIAVALVILLTWRVRPRRGLEEGFAFVYVNQDGSVRELSPDERVYLNSEFHGADGARPYIKATYKSRDGWGSMSGFITRRRVPARLVIAPVHPNYDAMKRQLGYDILGVARAAGDIIVTNADGSVTTTPNPNMSRRDRFELARSHQLAEQRRLEKLAKVTA